MTEAQTMLEPVGIFVDTCNGLMIKFSDGSHRRANMEERAKMLLSLRAASAPGAVREGWKLVPIEPAQNMIHAAYQGQPDAINVGFAQAYRSMLDVSPIPPAATPEEASTAAGALEGDVKWTEWDGAVYTDQPIFDAIAASTQIDTHPDGVPRIVMSARKFIDTFNNHRDRALCTSLAALPPVDVA